MQELEQPMEQLPKERKEMIQQKTPGKFTSTDVQSRNMRELQKLQLCVLCVFAVKLRRP
jgi:hypothetical protein